MKNKKVKRGERREKREENDRVKMKKSVFSKHNERKSGFF